MNFFDEMGQIPKRADFRWPHSNAAAKAESVQLRTPGPEEAGATRQPEYAPLPPTHDGSDYLHRISERQGRSHQAAALLYVLP